eukprot:scaffold47805_cov51-Phaeocystis_antarctica.AAC.2
MATALVVLSAVVGRGGGGAGGAWRLNSKSSSSVQSGAPTARPCRFHRGSSTACVEIVSVVWGSSPASGAWSRTPGWAWRPVGGVGATGPAGAPGLSRALGGAPRFRVRSSSSWSLDVPPWASVSAPVLRESPSVPLPSSEPAESRCFFALWFPASLARLVTRRSRSWGWASCPRSRCSGGNPGLVGSAWPRRPSGLLVPPRSYAVSRGLVAVVLWRVRLADAALSSLLSPELRLVASCLTSAMSASVSSRETVALPFRRASGVSWPRCGGRCVGGGGGRLRWWPWRASSGRWCHCGACLGGWWCCRPASLCCGWCCRSVRSRGRSPCPGARSPVWWGGAGGPGGPRWSSGIGPGLCGGARGGGGGVGR